MAKHLPSDVWRLAPCLTSDELLVLLALADYGERIFPSQAALAVKTRLHRSTVNRALHSLREKSVVQSKGSGKALTYTLQLSPAATGTCSPQRQVVSPAATGAVAPGYRDPNYISNQQTNQGAAEAAKGVVVSAWDGIDPEDRRRILRHPHGGEDIEAKHRVTLRELAKLGVRESEFPRWWRQLGKRWGDTGVEPYSTIADELEEIGADVRDRAAVLAFRLGVGRAAA